MKNMNYIRRGYGTPLLLVHGLGGSSSSWRPVMNALATEREIIAIDLPGFGETPPLEGEVSISTLADALTEFIAKQGLLGVDAVGSSMGARLVLELARRGEILGSVVSLSPAGFWQGFERHAFYASIYASIRMVRALEPMLPEIINSRAGRLALLGPFSNHPARIPADIGLQEMRNFLNAKSFDELLYQLAYGEEQKGAPFGSIDPSLVIAWGRQDRVCFPHEARRALKLFPDAKIRWFDHCGHYPQWDAPQETVQMILDNTGEKCAATRDLCRDLRRSATNAGLRTAAHVRSMPPDSPAL